MATGMTGAQQGQEIAAKFRQKGIEAKTKLANELLVCGLLVERKVKEYMTAESIVDTGRLRASIATRQTDQMSVETGTNVEYGPAVEYGTSRQPPHPYLHNTFEATKPEINKRMKAAMKTAMQKK